MRRTAMESDSRPSMGPTARPERGAAAALPAVGERLLPWLGAAVIVAVVILGALTVGEVEPSIAEIPPLLAGLSVTLAVAGLVAIRSARAVEVNEREERARPAREQLLDIAVGRQGEGLGARSYVDGMQRWTIALLELITHAMETTDDDQVRQELTSAGEDTDALRALLQASSQRDLTLSEVATLHSVCGLWETNEDRTEEMAAAVDPAWHRRWQARSVVERLLHHGPRLAADVDLPYRT